MLTSRPHGIVNLKRSHSLLRRIQILKRAVIVVRIASGRPQDQRATVTIIAEDNAEVEDKANALDGAGAPERVEVVVTRGETFQYTLQLAPLFLGFGQER